MLSAALADQQLLSVTGRAASAKHQPSFDH